MNNKKQATVRQPFSGVSGKESIPPFEPQLTNRQISLERPLVFDNRIRCISRARNADLVLLLLPSEKLSVDATEVLRYTTFWLKRFLNDGAP